MRSIAFLILSPKHNCKVETRCDRHFQVLRRSFKKQGRGTLWNQTRLSFTTEQSVEENYSKKKFSFRRKVMP